MPLKAIVGIAFAVFVLAAVVRYVEPQFAFFPTAGEDATPAELWLPFESAAIPTSDGERVRAWTLRHAAPRAAVVYRDPVCARPRAQRRTPGTQTFVRIAGGDHNDVAPADADTYWAAVGTFIDQLTRR